MLSQYFRRRICTTQGNIINDSKDISKKMIIFARP